MFAIDQSGEALAHAVISNVATVPDFVVVDVETSCSRVSSICQIGIVGFRNGVEIFEYETLVDPKDEFDGFNTRIHGIAAGHVVGQPCFGDIHATVDAHLGGRTTVAHSYFDEGALSAACRVHSRPMIETTWLDSVRVAKRAWPELSSHRLNVLSRHLGIAYRHHDALSDARAAGWVIVKAIEHTGMTLADWLAPTARRKAGPPPKPVADGPLRGQRIAILGDRETAASPIRSRRWVAGSSARRARRRRSSRSWARSRSATARATTRVSGAPRNSGGTGARSESSPRPIYSLMTLRCLDVSSVDRELTL